MNQFSTLASDFRGGPAPFDRQPLETLSLRFCESHFCFMAHGSSGVVLILSGGTRYTVRRDFTKFCVCLIDESRFYVSVRFLLSSSAIETSLNYIFSRSFLPVSFPSRHPKCG